MLVTDETANPYLEELSAAAAQIAELKHKIAKLEKMVDGIMALHLAGAAVPLAPGDDALRHQPDNANTGEEACAAIAQCDDVRVDDTSDDGSGTQTTKADACDDDSACPDKPTPHAADDTPKLPSGTLPTAVRSLICYPPASVLTATDDLTLIKGIDCATALELAAQDIASFQALADLDANAVACLKTNVSGADAIHQDGWIEQAAILASDTETLHAQTVKQQRRQKTKPADVCDQAGLQSDTITHEAAGRPIDASFSQLILDRPVAAASNAGSHAEALLETLSGLDLPREINIERPMTTLMRLPRAGASFIPEVDTAKANNVATIPGAAMSKETPDRGNLRAFAASLVATAVIYAATIAPGNEFFQFGIARVFNADVCQLTGLSAFPDACKQILGTVL